MNSSLMEETQSLNSNPVGTPMEAEQSLELEATPDSDGTQDVTDHSSKVVKVEENVVNRKERVSKDDAMVDKITDALMTGFSEEISDLIRVQSNDVTKSTTRTVVPAKESLLIPHEYLQEAQSRQPFDSSHAMRTYLMDLFTSSPDDLPGCILSPMPFTLPHSLYVNMEEKYSDDVSSASLRRAYFDAATELLAETQQNPPLQWQASSASSCLTNTDLGKYICQEMQKRKLFCPLASSVEEVSWPVIFETKDSTLRIAHEVALENTLRSVSGGTTSVERSEEVKRTISDSLLEELLSDSVHIMHKHTT